MSLAGSSRRLGSLEDFYARTQELPKPEQTKLFLENLPPNAVVLDYGCGTGRWAAAFLRDRPDLTIDVLDKNLDKANHISNEWKGIKYHCSFSQFRPDKSYKGIFAYDSLFSLPHDEMISSIAMLADNLKRDGVLMFTMLDDTSVARARFRDSVMSRQEIDELLDQNGLQPMRIEYHPKSRFGKDGKIIPTFLVCAKKR